MDGFEYLDGFEALCGVVDDVWEVVELVGFGDKFFDEFAVGVECLGLACGVEDAEVGLGVCADAGAPLPTACVGGEVPVEEFFGEVSFSPFPVDE